MAIGMMTKARNISRRLSRAPARWRTALTVPVALTRRAWTDDLVSRGDESCRGEVSAQRGPEESPRDSEYAHPQGHRACRKLASARSTEASPREDRRIRRKAPRGTLGPPRPLGGAPGLTGLPNAGESMFVPVCLRTRQSCRRNNPGSATSLARGGRHGSSGWKGHVPALPNPSLDTPSYLWVSPSGKTPRSVRRGLWRVPRSGKLTRGGRS